LFPNFKIINFCGSIDEPITHPEFFEILKEAYKINPYYTIHIHTNGSIRSENEWKELAVLLLKFKSPHMTLFSIDGLKDTNHIYRQNTDYDKIIKNSQAFIDAGGYAVWQFLIFPWNSHQINEAKDISIKMKFKEFHSRHDRSIVTSLGLENINEKKLKNQSGTSEYSGSLDDLIQSYENLNDVEISCNNQQYGMYFLSFDSKLWPCCFIPNGYLQLQQEKVDFLRKRIDNVYSKDFNDLTKKSVREILDSSFYKNDLVESWNNSVSTGPCGKITRCAETCNVKKLKALPIGSPKVLVKQ
jgi:MoaA/NifB/PqqE/SkfB family radical SAM enzyme